MKDAEAGVKPDDHPAENPPLASAWDRLVSEEQTTTGESVTVEYDSTFDQPIRAAGYVAVWRVEDGVWKKSLISFKRDLEKVSELSPFIYQKPVVSNGDKRFVAPENHSSDIRYNYLPIAIVSAARRPPNHLFIDDDLLFTMRNFGTDDQSRWEIRCFPKSCIPEKTWLEAVATLSQSTTH